MVKNLGGNKSKKLGRKYINIPTQKAVRLSKQEDEKYAVVTKLYGGANCEVLCEDNVSRMCVIRNKFRGRSKRDNWLSIGVWVLIGLRSWETVTDNKIEKCDLVSVYNSGDFEKVKNSVDKPWNTIKVEVGNHTIEKNDSDEFIFDNKNDELIEELQHNIETDKQEIFVIDDEDINIDDI